MSFRRPEAHLARLDRMVRRGLPVPLRIFAEWNPVSAVTQAARNLFGNTSPLAPTPEVWSMQNPELYTMIWVVALVAIFAPLSVRLYRTAANK